MSTTNVIRATRNGPITLDLRLIAGLIQVAVEDCRQAQVELTTRDDRGPAADAVNAPVIVDQGDRLSIDASVQGGVVQNVSYGRGGVQVNSFGGIQVGGNVYGAINIGGDVYHGASVGINSSPIIARVVLPIGSSLIAGTTSADILVRGPLEKAQVETVGGRIELDLVRDLDAKTVGGNIIVGELAGDGYAKTVGGDIQVRAGGPYLLKAKSVGGDITAPHPIRLDGRSVGGRVRNY